MQTDVKQQTKGLFISVPITQSLASKKNVQDMLKNWINN